LRISKQKKEFIQIIRIPLFNHFISLNEFDTSETKGIVQAPFNGHTPRDALLPNFDTALAARYIRLFLGSAPPPP
jgi:hypothetical protein